MLMVSGMVRITLYPLERPTAARPIPVLPLVGSIMVAPGCISPFSSASFIMNRATLSLALPAGLKDSILA